MFKWGIKRGVGQKKKENQFYGSFIYYDVEYFLNDYVSLYGTTDVETHIGKLVQMYETPEHGHIVKVIWLFRPVEIRNFLRGYEPRWNELFLACGEGQGVSNFNFVDSIIGKCNVVCTSPDRRNPQPSEEQLGMADYIFRNCFDVGQLRITRKFPDNIHGIKVELFFNKCKDPKETAPTDADGHRERRKFDSKRQMVQGAKSKKRVTFSGVQECISGGNAMLRPKVPIDTTESKKRVTFSGVQECISGGNAMLRPKIPIDTTETDGSNVLPVKKRKLLLDEEDEEEAVLSEGFGPQAAKGVSTASNIGTKTNYEKRRWFDQKQIPWLERLKRAEEAGTLVLLENLDPSLTSSEVEDLVRDAFNQIVEAKMIQRNTHSNPYYGKALVMFDSKVEAVSAISKLNRSCLVMEDGRPIVGRKGAVNDLGKVVNYCGHLSMYKLKQRQTEEMRKAVSTSHFSQQNTLEFDMAIEWCTLQEQANMCWEKLFTKQAGEIEVVKRSKMNES
ncbi:nucleic acid binding [Euphorbia peplus]|nr:nucleic acid binding [Euphorbia peplus]